MIKYHHAGNDHVSFTSTLTYTQCVYFTSLRRGNLKALFFLQRAFSEFCLFFYDKYGGRCIAVVWKPQAFVPQPFKVFSYIAST